MTDLGEFGQFWSVVDRVRFNIFERPKLGRQHTLTYM